MGNYLIVNLIKLSNLNDLNIKLKKNYRRLKEELTTFDKELQQHNITETEYKIYKKQMESNQTI